MMVRSHLIIKFQNHSYKNKKIAQLSKKLNGFKTPIMFV